jgi:hypothetical protein
MHTRVHLRRRPSRPALAAALLVAALRAAALLAPAAGAAAQAAPPPPAAGSGTPTGTPTGLPTGGGYDVAPGQALDSAYTAQIRALTPVDPRYKFTTEMVDHLPASATVPTPLKVLGYVPGTVGRLSKTADVNRYFRAVAAASPRVKVFSLGRSEEGREMLVAAVANEATLARLDEYRGMAGRLADPRGLAEPERGGSPSRPSRSTGSPAASTPPRRGARRC